MTQASVPPGWYPDPAGTPDVRWWDGHAWTHHTQPAVQQPPPRQYASQQAVPEQYGQQPAGPEQPGQQQYGQQPVPENRSWQQSAGRSPLLDQPLLVVSQKTKLVELTNEYKVSDGNGQQIGAVVEVGQSGARKVLRFVSNLDQYLTHRLEVRDATGPVLVLTRPAKLVKSRMVVTRPDGQPVGEIIQANVFGKIRFDLVVGGQAVGGIQAENWRAWDFAVVDGQGIEVARITKTWEGLARAVFTTADNYAVQVHRRLEDPLASLVVAAALTVDTALKQDDH